MKLFPNPDEFAERYEAGDSQVVWTTLVADLDTPVSVLLKLAGESPNSFLLESVEGGEVRGRYSIIGMKPDLIWRCRGNRAEVNRSALTRADAFEPCSGDALSELRRLIDDSRIELPESLPPMAAGLVGYMSYDTVRLMERLPRPNPDVLGLPDGVFVRPTVMAIFDSVKDLVTLVTPVRPAEGIAARAAYESAVNTLSVAVAGVEQGQYHAQGRQGARPGPSEPSSNLSREAFCGMVNKAKEYIAAGDIFQVVLSQRFSLPFELPPFALYRALRRTNPSPFMYFLNFDDGFAIVGSSPEILVRLRDDTVTVRPIAGTRRRGANRTEDAALARELLADPKERAEHLMLLDLGRNDVGRVARIGSVKVTEQMVIEHYSHVMHIVSNVQGEIDDRYGAMDALCGAFPAGTVSGAPKVRAMQIIDELEPEKRGVYAGAIGYFSANGSMDTCIALRTAIVKDGTMYVQAGSGIVADSDPAAEYEESRNKAHALIRAAEEAVRFAALDS
ncbi:MAG: anthranilate synthase component I [Gammaproteobacteria bacterium]|nr:anthranilate synthase component I [Gammaproteobacteria bacterium]MCY3988787.1 anthranilate synthase component I [Gammaproteobacteria bacterium]